LEERLGLTYVADSEIEVRGFHGLFALLDLCNG